MFGLMVSFLSISCFSHLLVILPLCPGEGVARNRLKWVWFKG